MVMTKLSNAIISMLLVLAIFHFANPSFMDQLSFDISTEKSAQEGENIESDDKEAESPKLFFTHAITLALFCPPTKASFECSAITVQQIKNRPYKPPIFS
jgi:hypothetical protein